MSFYPLLLAVHIVAGLGAVLIGIAPVLTRKGSRLHRLTGRAFAVLMAVLLAAAWAMTAIRRRWRRGWQTRASPAATARPWSIWRECAN